MNNWDDLAELYLPALGGETPVAIHPRTRGCRQRKEFFDGQNLERKNPLQDFCFPPRTQPLYQKLALKAGVGNYKVGQLTQERWSSSAWQRCFSPPKGCFSHEEGLAGYNSLACFEVEKVNHN